MLGIISTILLLLWFLGLITSYTLDRPAHGSVRKLAPKPSGIPPTGFSLLRYLFQNVTI